MAKAMKAHEGSLLVQRQATGVLYSVLMAGGKERLGAQPQAIARACGIKARVEAAVRGHPTDKTIQAMGEAIPALGWVMVEKTPGPHVADSW